MSNNSSCVCYTEYVYKIVDAPKYEIIDYKKQQQNNINYNSTNLAYKRTIDRSTNQQCNHLVPAIGSTEPPVNMDEYANFTPSDHKTKKTPPK